MTDRISLAAQSMWRAGYDAGFEEGRRQAVQAMQSLAEISAKIDVIAEPISRGKKKMTEKREPE